MKSASLARRVLLGFALIGLAAVWGVVIAVYLSGPSTAVWIATVTIAALVTEATFWLFAIVGGWTLFANRARLWRRLTGRTGTSEKSGEAAR